MMIRQFGHNWSPIFKNATKFYIPSILNTDFIFWQPKSWVVLLLFRFCGWKYILNGLGNSGTIKVISSRSLQSHIIIPSAIDSDSIKVLSVLHFLWSKKLKRKKNYKIDVMRLFSADATLFLKKIEFFFRPPKVEKPQ
jgi:hypothetical protein